MTTVHEETISELERQIRDFINQARRQHALLKDSGAWNQLCSSLDVIGDTELAFDAYDEAPDTDDAGATYILVYGVLQALVLQQDAVRHLPRLWAWPMNPTRSSWKCAKCGMPVPGIRQSAMGGRDHTSSLGSP